MRLKTSIKIKDYGGMFAGRDIITNCWDKVGQSGNTIGYNSGIPVGGLTPNTLSSGTFIYALSVDDVSNEFALKLGVAGDYQEPNMSQTVLSFTIDNVQHNILLVWDASKKYYSEIDEDAKDALLTMVGNEQCLALLTPPDLLLHFDYDKIEVAV